MVPRKIACVIPAKGISNRLYRKNLQTINRKSLLEIAIMQAKEAKFVNEIIVTSEDTEILHKAKEFGAVPFERNASLSVGETDILFSVKEVAERFYKTKDFLILQCDNPFRTSAFIDNCIKKYFESESEDLITKIGNNRTGSVRILNRKSLFKNVPTSHITIIEDSHNYVDIHTKKDLNLARFGIPKCYLCESDNVERFKKEMNLFECNDCGVVFQYPQNDFGYSEYASSRKEGRKKRLRQYVMDINQIMRFVEGGEFLDVGCGSGTFLKHLPASFVKNGIDIRDTPYWEGDFLDFHFKKNFDVIHLRAVIEHVKNPLAYIEKSKELLSNDGLLVISHIPNIDNYPKMRGLIKLDEHIFYFNPESMINVLEKSRFDVADIIFPYFKSPYQNDEDSHFMNVFSIFAYNNSKSSKPR